MKALHVLATGDYWHDDFTGVLSRIESPVTMVPVDRMDSVPHVEYDVIVLAQSRRDQFSQQLIDDLRTKLPNVPIVVLLGSWCEGQNRSGEPLIGVNNVLWSQWKNRFEQFAVQLSSGQTTDWHQPLTATSADRIRGLKLDSTIVDKLAGTKIAISSLDRTSFESNCDVLSRYGCNCLWLESLRGQDDDDSFDLAVVDGNTVSDAFDERVTTIQQKFAAIPMIAILNCPRQQDIERLAIHGIKEVVAKPFSQLDLVFSVSRLLNLVHERTESVRRPTIASSTTSLRKKV